MIDIIKEKLGRYGATNALEEENALKEILQEIALYALWRADFFDCALFQGGTSLRILHGLPRFSEDLDFLLRVPNRFASAGMPYPLMRSNRRAAPSSSAAWRQ